MARVLRSGARAYGCDMSGQIIDFDGTTMPVTRVRADPFLPRFKNSSLASQVVVEIERSAGYAERIITRSIGRAGRE